MYAGFKFILFTNMLVKWKGIHLIFVTLLFRKELVKLFQVFIIKMESSHSNGMENVIY